MSYSGFEVLSYTVQPGVLSQLDSITFDAKNYLRVVIKQQGSTVAGTLRVLFNGSATGYSYNVATNLVTATGVSAAFMAVANVAATSTDAVQITMDVINFSGRPKSAVWMGASGIEGAPVSPVMIHGAGIWDTTSQITKVSMVTSAGVFNAASSISVFGYN